MTGEGLDKFGVSDTQNMTLPQRPKHERAWNTPFWEADNTKSKATLPHSNGIQGGERASKGKNGRKRGRRWRQEEQDGKEPVLTEVCILFNSVKTHWLFLQKERPWSDLCFKISSGCSGFWYRRTAWRRCVIAMSGMMPERPGTGVRGMVDLPQGTIEGSTLSGNRGIWGEKGAETRCSFSEVSKTLLVKKSQKWGSLTTGAPVTNPTGQVTYV